ncbi:LysM peptidoglycan-binding domain-containing protein [Hydrogenophaga sp. BPS33]|uniref:LysM peptidoglycan-binding domain-containing protein n=1 Tax=Hydrogenophaga sp. BPS33 TaxID=2651974 RepID=UPI00131F7D39|nr:LysM peptidoglycan-binding domain-containing protein [Hydrogenophaga sp. BPS33]QHE89081.1 LysM peptidoglycan-binding domain-containing protein [Hydrogenophaga sp. BPS33]
MHHSLSIPSRSLRQLHPLRPLACAAALLATFIASGAAAQNFPITPSQRATADQVAQMGVPLSALAPNAPDSYTIKRGDTLWAISGIFLKTPWRWPELWGMNRQDIENPHRIYPGQVLYLVKSGDRALLSTRPAGSGDPATVRVTPRTRYESLGDSAVPPVSLQAIAPFLTEPMVVDEATFARAPRIVATQENRVLLTRGDRAYARALYGDSAQGEPLRVVDGKSIDYRVFRNAVPLRDPTTGEVLGYEAQYVGKSQLISSETTRPAADDKTATELIPAAIDIVSAKEEIRIGDRLLPEPERELSNYVPRAPDSAQSGQIVSVYGNAVRYAAQNQVVTINRGREHGIERGHVLAIQRETSVLTDATDPARPQVRLPGERNGLMMVFRTFDKVSYALVLQITDGVKVGDRFINP